MAAFQVITYGRIETFTEDLDRQTNDDPPEGDLSF